MNAWEWLVFSLMAGIGTTGAATADTVTLNPVRDNTLYEDPTGMLSNGAGQFLFAGNNATGATRRGLIQFDIAGSIPVGSTIDAATLVLNMSQSPNAINRDVSLHGALADWGEGASNATAVGGGGGAAATTGDATWLHTFFNTTQWSSAGGEFLATPSATTAGGAVGGYSWSSPQLHLDVQNWLDAPATNFGWLLLADESTNQTVKRFDTRENTTAAFRPTLAVEYTPIPEPATCGLTAFGFVVLLATRLRRRNA